MCLHSLKIVEIVSNWLNKMRNPGSQYLFHTPENGGFYNSDVDDITVETAITFVENKVYSNWLDKCETLLVRV